MTNFEYSMKDVFHLNLNWIKSYSLYYTCIVLKWTTTFLYIYYNFKPKKIFVFKSTYIQTQRTTETSSLMLGCRRWLFW